MNAWVCSVSPACLGASSRLCVSLDAVGDMTSLYSRDSDYSVSFFVNIFFSVLLMIWEWTHFSYSFSFFFFFVVVRVNRLFYAGFRSYLSKGSSTMENCPTSSGEEYKAFNREILSVCLPTS